jgi:hypothetical protein
MRVSRRGTRPPAAIEAAESSALAGVAVEPHAEAAKNAAQRAAFGFMAESIAGFVELRNGRIQTSAGIQFQQQVVECRGKSRYYGNADEFVRQGFIRVRTGWRREEWAYCPLFICGKFGKEIT